MDIERAMVMLISIQTMDDPCSQDVTALDKLPVSVGIQLTYYLLDVRIIKIIEPGIDYYSYIFYET